MDSMNSHASEDMRNRGFNEPLIQAVESGDVSAARAAIITHADSDYFAGTATALLIADHASEFLKAKGVTLFMPDDGSIALTVGQWDEEVWNRAKAALRLNFSREKLDYITKLVRQHKTARTSVSGTPGAFEGHTNSYGNSARCCSCTNYLENSSGGESSSISGHSGTMVFAIAAGVVIGGGIGAVVAGTFKAVVAGAIAGGVVGGGILFLKK